MALRGHPVKGQRNNDLHALQAPGDEPPVRSPPLLQMQPPCPGLLGMRRRQGQRRRQLWPRLLTPRDGGPGVPEPPWFSVRTGYRGGL